jgi:hypothetical protein
MGIKFKKSVTIGSTIMIILVLIKLQLSDVIIFLNIYLEISIFVNFNIHVFKLVNDSHLRDEIASHIRRNYDFFLFTHFYGT